MDIVGLLDQLSELKAASDVTRLDYDAKRKVILASVQDQLDDLDVEYNPLFEAVAPRITELEAEVKQLVLAGGKSVKGSGLHAVYMAGRVSWDTKRLDGFLVAHPELATLRTVGEPSVQLRNVK